MGRSDRTIKPGESDEVKFTVSTTRLTGRVSRTATVYTNDPEHKRGKLTCVIPVKTALTLKPSSVRFRDVDRTAKEVHQTVTITRGDGGPLKPELEPLKHPNIDASLREIEAGERYELDVTVHGPWPKSRYVRATLKLKTGVSQAPEQVIPVYARIAPRLRANPPRFLLRADQPARRRAQSKLVWSGGKPGKVLEVSCSDPRLAVRLEEDKDKNEQLIVLEVPPDYKPETRRLPRVTVKTDDPEAAQLLIPVYMPRPAPPVRALPSRLALPQGMSNEVELRSRLLWSGKPGKVLEAKASDEQLSVRVEGDGSTTYVVVRVPPGYMTPPNAHPFVTVRTDNQRAPIVRIQLIPAGPPPERRPPAVGQRPDAKEPSDPGKTPRSEQEEPSQE